MDSREEMVGKRGGRRCVKLFIHLEIRCNAPTYYGRRGKRMSFGERKRGMDETELMIRQARIGLEEMGEREQLTV